MKMGLDALTDPEVTDAASRKWQRTLKGDEGQQALERCLCAGLVMMLAQASWATTIQRDQLQDIFTDFFKEPATSYQINRLLRGKSLDQEELVEIFDDLGYDPAVLLIYAAPDDRLLQNHT